MIVRVLLALLLAATAHADVTRRYGWPLTNDQNLNNLIRAVEAQMNRGHSLKPAGAGDIQLGNDDTICFRNSTNTADCCLNMGGTNTLSFSGGCTIAGSGGGVSTFDQLGSGTNLTATMTCGTGCTVNASGSGVIAATTAAALASAPTACGATISATGIGANGNATGCFQPALITGTPVVSQVGVWVDATHLQGFADYTYTNGPPTLTVGVTQDGSIGSHCTPGSGTCKADFTDNTVPCPAPSAGITRLCSVAGRIGQIVNGGALSNYLFASSTDALTNKTYNTASVGNVFLINGHQITDITGDTATLASASGSFVNGNCVRVTIAAGRVDFVDAGTTCGGGSTPRLDQVLDPNVAKSFTMATNTLAFVFGNITAGPSWTITAGALTGTPSVSQVLVQDTTGNTNTGPLLDVDTLGTSTAMPVRFCAQGTTNCVQMDSTGSLAPINSGRVRARWNNLMDPTGGAQSLAMAAFTTTWTWGAATGSNNGVLIHDTASNTGNATLVWIRTESGSAMVPFEVTAQGTANGFFEDANGVVQPLGVGKIAPRMNDITNTIASWVVTDGFGTQINITSGASGSWNLNVSSTNTGSQDKIIFNDFNGNTGTGYLHRINTVGTSTMKPLGVCAQGTVNCVQVDANGVLTALGTGGVMPSSTYIWIPATPVADNAVSVPGSANQFRCEAFVPDKSIRNATKLAWGITAAASTACGVAIYDASGNLIATSGAKDCSTGMPGTVTATGITAFSLFEGTKYYRCFCNNGTTGSYAGPSASASAGHVESMTNAFVTNAGLGTACTAGAPPSPMGALSATIVTAPFIMVDVE